MEKAIAITKDDYCKAVAKISAEVMADHSKDNPETTLLFSLASIAFAGRLKLELFGPDEDEDGDEDTEDPSSMRKELDHFCQSMDCNKCPLGEDGFVCGRCHYFIVPPRDPDCYMDDETIAKHYKRMKEYKNER